MPSRISPPRTTALEYICQRQFHRRFLLPRTANHGELPITYADVGTRPETTNDHVPTFLFMPGMFGSRYLAIYMQAIAERLGVRVLVIDRPGMGGSASVPDESRVDLWVELVPLLLAHLSIDHVALMAHSAGTIYLLNTLFYCRDILDPAYPYVALLAPCVDPAHSHITALQLARLIPTKAFSVWNQIPRFFQTSPVMASSGAVIGSIKDTLSTNSDDITERKRLYIEREFGMAREVQIELEKNTARFFFKENSVGANSEALQCLKKGASWGICEDYAQFVKALAELERRRDEESTSSKITIRAYFAESDAMVGKTGQKYFEKCFTEIQDVLHFDSTTVPDENHDSICISPEILAKIFRDAKAGLSREPATTV